MTVTEFAVSEDGGAEKRKQHGDGGEMHVVLLIIC